MDNSGITSSSPRKLLVVDGHSYAYRAFYAIRKLSSPTGKPTNAIYGFIRMLHKMRSAHNFSHIMVVWDGGLCTKRMTLLPQYKMQRAEMPSDLESQLDPIFRFLALSKISSFLRENIEADDWIATLTTRAVEQGFFVTIASADKDFMQLVSDKVGLLNPNDKTEKIWTSQDVISKAGVPPSQIVDWLSLIGDTVDNIPGVAGIGPLRAAELMTKFGSIENLYRNLNEVTSERIRLALRGAEADVRRNQSLIRLHIDLPDGISWESLASTLPDAMNLLSFYEECGFKTLVRELQASFIAQGNLL